MTAPRTLVLTSVCCLALGACDFLIARKSDDTDANTKIETVAPPTEDVAGIQPAADDTSVVVASTANIDWEAARRDMASTPSSSRETTGFQVEAEAAAPPVPVLLPTGIVVPQGAESGVRFQPMSDGYFATYPGIDYDIIVNGTNEVLEIPGDSTPAEDSALTYTPTMTGAQVSFSRYGADYLVEFECKSIEGGEADCISEDEALEVTRKLVIAGTR